MLRAKPCNCLTTAMEFDSGHICSYLPCRSELARALTTGQDAPPQTGSRPAKRPSIARTLQPDGAAGAVQHNGLCEHWLGATLPQDIISFCTQVVEATSAAASTAQV